MHLVVYNVKLYYTYVVVYNVIIITITMDVIIMSVANDHSQ